MRTSPDGALVYVTSESDHTVTVFAAATGDIVSRIPVARRPRDISFTFDGKRAFVSAEIDGAVSVVDVASATVIATISLPKGSRSMGVVVSPDDRRLYVSNGRARTISVVDLETLEVQASVEVGERPWGLAWLPTAGASTPRTDPPTTWPSWTPRLSRSPPASPSERCRGVSR